MIFWFWTKALNTNKLGYRQFSLLISNMRPTECFHCWYALGTTTLARIWFWAWNFKCDERILTSRIIVWVSPLWVKFCGVNLSETSDTRCYFLSGAFVIPIFDKRITKHEFPFNHSTVENWAVPCASNVIMSRNPDNKSNLGINSTFPHVQTLSSLYAALSTST